MSAGFITFVLVRRAAARRRATAARILFERSVLVLSPLVDLESVEMRARGAGRPLLCHSIFRHRARLTPV
jgi:hypothetical protein